MSAIPQNTMAPVDLTTVGPGNGHPVVQPPVLGGSDYTDYYLLNDLLDDEQKALRRKVRDFMDQEVTPIINPYWERAEFPHELVPKIAQLGISGLQIKGYGCPGFSNVTAGVVILELARGDLSISTFTGVHAALAMMSIALLGSDEQRARFLPPMARLEKIGAFGLTEPAHGTDAVKLETTARKDGDAYVLNGHKRWIGNATFADYVIIWARGEDGHVGGYVVEKGTPGFEAEVITGKTALRCVQNAQISLTDVRVPAENRLADVHTFRDTEKVLLASRFCVAWEAIGAAIAGYETALAYAKQRKQFGIPLAAFQLIQYRLSRMLADITDMLCMQYRLSQLMDEGKFSMPRVALAKMHYTERARAILADARDMLGGNGIILDYHVARHLCDIEAIDTYEGTDTVQALIVGRDITGYSAFVPPTPGAGR
ncbi:acyl-CoA dehydrogenase family protein [Streptomyces yunnanensis]|uniref:Glutaryl-CoA dehydrogenase n=1 Tax=Streptomyces yunnanensis TaxID=156453 RepID=A0A9X8QQN0_9ACTN|nr:acyl-CoA dehydrogenase family protein [Streptomyces yunnanensis]SHL39443.1 glutaryl-CoA dehydrogenase [Streptomyces yunnanensis]